MESRTVVRAASQAVLLRRGAGGLDQVGLRFDAGGLARVDKAMHVGNRPTEDVEGGRVASMHALLISRAGAGDLAHLGELFPWLDEHG